MYNSCIVTNKEQKMTRKHFVILAKKISEIPNKEIRLQNAIETAKICASVNPRFDQARFFEACGV